MLTATLTSFTPILADSAAFLNTTAGETLIRLLSAVGLILLIVAVIKSGMQVLSGSIGKAISIMFGAVVFVAFLFNPGLITGLIDWVGSLIQMVIESGQGLSENGGSGGSGGTNGGNINQN